ncbi:Transcriptional regulator, MarR family [Pediococcus damnosus]|uniref:Transcriptional regulator, MarR family n=1 Tax=Pediococcus damnosus TaxID=51663 RepID=A0AAC9B3H9_9LACO|nr:MarR family winged helix-turn-helix transcriptional regulator [Pediococcus damnosus]AMV63617.1 Transcriptional regulator, MarR family [Pediococcus damnosus]AMV66442.1 Transcriptional regulator, MarR family [Pediococcus damnosus]AMV68744.1 Transcriptional regulator, MarR family [Pediococcus damnosus]KJU73566.1 MarR family transcriptional regulator [Pediococcus damnosus LMG 28219]KRN53992.1 transcriptional regulator [Pediococcus damnosus]
MTNDIKEPMNQFGKLFQQKAFVFAAIKSTQSENDVRGNERGQQRVLRLLFDKDSLTNSQIVEELDIRPSSASVLVGKLEDNGLVKKTESPDDKRVTFISLTEQGRQAITKARQFNDDLSDSMFDALSDEEQKQLTEILTKLNADLEKKSPKWDGPRGWKGNSADGRFNSPNFGGVPNGFNFRK